MSLAFKLGSSDWPSFFSNISAELFGAILILLLVERRFRMSEIRYLKGVKQSTITYIISVFLPEARNVVGYAHVLGGNFRLFQNNFTYPDLKSIRFSL